MSDDLVKQWDEYVESMGCVMGEAEHMAQQMRGRIEDLEAKLAECEARLEKAVEVLERVMVGGNHLAILLHDNFPPAETEPLTALNIMGAGEGYEVWCCWRCIMLARATLAELKGGKHE